MSKIPDGHSLAGAQRDTGHREGGRSTGRSHPGAVLALDLAEMALVFAQRVAHQASQLDKALY
jgi:hypothetical protein